MILVCLNKMPNSKDSTFFVRFVFSNLRYYNISNFALSSLNRKFAVTLQNNSKITYKIYDRTEVGTKRRRGDTSIVRTGCRACTGAVAEDKERV